MHWAQSYVGQPYVEGAHDCAAFAARVQREIFRREIRLPTERGAGLRAQSRQIDDLAGVYAERVERPAEGDGVLMRCRGTLSHVGVYCEIGGTAYVLHAMKNAGQVCLHRLRDLANQGLAVEGFYRWK